MLLEYVKNVQPEFMERFVKRAPNQVVDVMRQTVTNMLCFIIVSTLFTPRGLRAPLLLDKPVTGWRSSKAALQSEAGQGSKRGGLTQGKLDSPMYGSTSPGLQMEVTNKPRMRQT